MRGLPPEILNLKVFLGADYSQIEIRALAELSGDRLLVKQLQEAGRDAAWAKKHNKDIHCQVGATLTGWPLEKIANDHDTRRAVKGLHFAIVFGKRRENLHAQLAAEGVKISKRRTLELYDAYFRKYPGVARYMDRQQKQAEELGYVESLFGFRREIHRDDEDRKTFWGNQAINSPVQSSAHQLLLMALALLHVKPKTYRLLQEPLMEIHDALYWRVRLRDLAGAYRQCKQLMEYGTVEYAERKFGIKLRVPLVAEASAGFCLGTMLPYTGADPTAFLPEWRANHARVEAESWEKLHLEAT